jgi:hypothetical protein
MLRVHHVIYVLLALSALFAFVIPPQAIDPIRGNLRFGFYPISWPISSVLNLSFGKIAPPRERDDGAIRNPDSGKTTARDTDAIVHENNLMRVKIASLTGQLARLEEMEAQRGTVGEVRDRCKPSRVLGVGADAAQRQTLLIAAGSHEGVVDRMPVLYGDVGGGGVAGRIAPGRAQLAGSVVQLITDKGFRAGVRFARFVPRADGAGLDFKVITTGEVLAEGDGKGAMWIRNLTWKDATAAGIKPDDWVILQDEDWPDALQRYRLGKIDSIARRPNAAGFAEIKVTPPTDLLNLREVLVMTQ